MDYVQEAIDLAKGLSIKQNHNINYYQDDMLNLSVKEYFYNLLIVKNII